MKQTMAHSTVGEVGLPGFPYEVGGEPLAVRQPAPLLGEQTEDILSELGFTDEEIATISGR